MTVYPFIESEKAHHAVSTLCRVLEVSRSGFYAWHARRPSPRQRENERLTLEVREIYASNKGRYGSPRVHRELVDRATASASIGSPGSCAPRASRPVLDAGTACRTALPTH